MDNPSIWQIFKQGLKHFCDSKTNFGLLWMSILGFAGFIIILVLYGEVLLGELLMFLAGNGGFSAVRAVGVDGAPKIAAAWQNPNSLAANPPPAVSTPIATSTVSTGLAPMNFNRPQ